MAKMSRNEVVPTSGTHNVLAIGTVIKGDICAEENFRIDGTIEGTINSKGRIVVGPQSNITGTIECVNMEVMGRVNGTIICSDTLTIRSTAQITGEVSTLVLEIEPGAKFDGTSTMTKPKNNYGSSNSNANSIAKTNGNAVHANVEMKAEVE